MTSSLDRLSFTFKAIYNRPAMTYNIWDLGRDSVVDILTKTPKTIIETLLQRVVG